MESQFCLSNGKTVCPHRSAFPEEGSRSNWRAWQEKAESETKTPEEGCSRLASREAVKRLPLFRLREQIRPPPIEEQLVAEPSCGGRTEDSQRSNQLPKY